MSQIYDKIESIIVDDAAPDDSIIKCNHLISIYTGPIQFLVIHHIHNLGLSAARNSGTKAATGEYLYYLGSDDEITPDCIDILLKAAIDNPDVEMVIGNAEAYTYNQDKVLILKNNKSSVLRSRQEIQSNYRRRESQLQRGIN